MIVETACRECGGSARALEVHGAPAAAMCAGCAADRRDPVIAPRRLGGFELMGRLGRGTFGVVHEARHTEHDTLAAVKIVAQDDPRAKRREGPALEQIRHPNVLHIFDFGVEPELFLATELIPGGASTRIESPESPLAAVLELGAELFEGLAAIHAAGYVHRDVKPGNVLIRNDRPPFRGVVADFGLAKRFGFDESFTATGQPGGTTAFASPEELLDFKRAGQSTDLYSAAATLYRWLTRELVFELASFDPTALQRAVLKADRIPLRERRPDVPEDIARRIDGLVTKHPAVRQAARAAEIAEALRRAV